MQRHLAVVTGASTGIGYELARYAAAKATISSSPPTNPRSRRRRRLRSIGAAGRGGASRSFDEGRRRKALRRHAKRAGQSTPCSRTPAGARHGLSRPGPRRRARRSSRPISPEPSTSFIRVGRDMRDTTKGRILITGSIAGFIPGSYQAVYNASKAFLNSFSFALRNELKDTGVTVTCLMPGATETEFFDRADMVDTKIGTSDPAEVARRASRRCRRAKATRYRLAQQAYRAIARNHGGLSPSTSASPKARRRLRAVVERLKLADAVPGGKRARGERRGSRHRSDRDFSRRAVAARPLPDRRRNVASRRGMRKNQILEKFICQKQNMC